MAEITIKINDEFMASLTTMLGAISGQSFQLMSNSSGISFDLQIPPATPGISNEEFLKLIINGFLVGFIGQYTLQLDQERYRQEVKKIKPPQATIPDNILEQ